MKKKVVALTLCSIASIMFFLIGKVEAQETVYPTPIKVEIYINKSVTVTPNGSYLVNNLLTGEKRMVAPNTPIVLTRSATNYSASFGSNSLSSSKGFAIKELNNINEVLVFEANKEAKREATTTSITYQTFKTGEAVEFVSKHNNDWYIVKLQDGRRAAVSSDKTKVVKVNQPSTLKIGSTSYRGSIYYNSGEQVINELDIEDYLKGVVPKEMPASWHMEALKSQAVAARSYAFQKRSSILTSTVSSQVYGGVTAENSRTNSAVDSTKGKIIYYNGKVIEAYFHSTSGGRTANVGDVWRSDQKSFPYLVSREDKFENSPYSTWNVNFNSATILSNFGLSTSTVLYNITTIPKGANGEVGGVKLLTSAGEKVFNGVNELDVRKMFTQGGKYLNSNWFNIEVKPEYSIQQNTQTSSLLNIKGAQVQLANGSTTISTPTVQIQMKDKQLSKESDPPSISINGKGFGHRIGMSQYGANGYANNGWTYDKILTHYYYGTTLGNIK